MRAPKPLRFLALTALAASLIWSGSVGLRAQASPSEPAVLRVLFIGNSFTFVNSLPEVLAGIAKSLPKGPAIEPTMVATGGMTLQWHLAAGKAAAAIESRQWDYVVLQEQSALGAGSEDGESRLSPPGLFHQSVRTFVPRIRATGATPLLLMTWAFEEAGFGRVQLKTDIRNARSQAAIEQIGRAHV